MTILKLLHGKDVLDLNTGRYCLDDADFRPPTTASTPVFGRSTIGADLVTQRAENRSWSFTVNIEGASPAECERALRDIQRFLAHAGEIAEPLYVAFRSWDTPAYEPHFGQFGSFKRYEVVYGTAEATREYINPLTYNRLVGVVLSLIIRPYAIGLEQPVGLASGCVLENFIGQADGQVRGLSIEPAFTNQFSNPAFMNSTWDTDWTATGTGFTVSKNTDPQYVLFGDTSARLQKTSLITVSGNRWTQSLTLTAVTWYISCYIKMIDSSSPGSINLWYNGNTISTTATSIGNGWYRLTASTTGTGGAAELGITFTANITIGFVDGFQATIDGHREFRYGDFIGCAWNTTKNRSVTNTTASVLKYRFSEMFGFRTGWTVRLVWTPPIPYTSATRRILEDSSSDIRIQINSSDQVVAQVSSGNSLTTSAITITAGTPLVLHITYDGSTITVYKDGTSVSSGGSKVAGTAEATNVFVGSDTSTGNYLQGTINGLAVFQRAMTQADVTGDYTAVAQQMADKEMIDSLPYMWTVEGDAIVDNENDDTDDFNYAVFGGLDGDYIEAAWYSKNSAAYNSTYGLMWGVLPVDPRQMDKDIITTAGTNTLLFVNGSGTADANANQGNVERQSTNTTALEFCDSAVVLPTFAMVAGREVYGAAVIKDAGSNLQLRLVVKFGSEKYYSDWRNVTASGAFYSHVVGPLFIPQRPPLLKTDQSIGFAIEAKRSVAGAANLDMSHASYFFNFSQFDAAALSSPSGADSFYARNRDIYIASSSGTSTTGLGRSALLPRPLYLQGQRQNVMNMAMSADTRAWVRADTSTLNKTSVIPRWHIL